MQERKVSFQEVVARRYVVANSSLYHVTTADKLPSIRATGLKPGGVRTIGAKQYDEHAKGKVFLTSFGGIDYWFERLSNFIFDKYEPQEYLALKKIPVVLRVQNPPESEKDELGSSDATHDAFMTKETIAPSQLTVYVDGKWAPLTALKKAHMQSAVTKGEDKWDVDLRSNDSPLFPKSP